MELSFSHYMSLLHRYLRPQWLKVCLLLLLLAGSIGLELYNPQLLKHFIDSIRGSLDSLLWLSLLFIGLICLHQILTTLASYLSENIGWQATNELRLDLALHCLNLDMSFHKGHTPGELLERVDGDVAQLSDFFSQFIFSMLGRGLLLVGILAVTFWTDGRLGLLLLASTALLLVSIRSLRGITAPSFRAARQASAELASFFEERLISIEDISSNGAQPYVLARLNHLSRRSLRCNRLSGVSGRFFSTTVAMSITLTTAAVLTLGAYLLRHGQMSLGTIYATYTYTSLLSSSLNSITLQLNKMQVATASLQRITELYNTPNALLDGPGAERPEGALAVTFKQVGFGYSPEQSVLQDISFELAQGRTLGLLGRTGSGKTTLTRLLYRTYDTREGAVLLGNIDVRQYKLSELRSRIGIVTQDVQLFQASIRDNLTFFDANISDERILEALVHLGLTSWYESLPDGLDTTLAPAGKSLSSGESQLLAFARVFLQNPALVILDEASSRLDPMTEKLIEGAVQRLLEGRTGIIIAHHLETVRHVDNILILDEGRIQEYGPRQQLAIDPTSRFAHLLQTGLTEVLA
ncbi:ABC transporter ATP-binding protein [Dictyobacter aurantiacus]|uniref:Helicase n=1 Tax=Dictyobacter aurantiacus TaxID=1936993 RepID=A0A401ZQ30_9CHLR|nr:ABC transporter ATP-binding protein [Dictyobacter aurantiacus]GCE08920.1 helicase [Dictyobacter aurantiacus]